MVLVVTLRQLSTPDGAAPYLSAFADKQVTVSQCELPAFVGREPHAVNGGDVNASPQDIGGAKEGETLVCGANGW
jgi:hypothetical protein